VHAAAAVVAEAKQGELHEETNDTKIPRKRHELNGDKSTAIDGLG